MIFQLLLLTFIGISGTYAGCPPVDLICPCTCKIISDTVDDDFAVLICENIEREDVLSRALAAAKGEKLFELQIVNSTLRYLPHDAFHNTTFEVINLENSSISALSDTNVAFDGLQNSLQLLEIINCSFLTNWDWTQLSHLKYLMEIAVQQSDLLDITNGLNNVQHLMFESFLFNENNIEWLDSHVFSSFKLLIRVALDKNHIDHLERTMFPRPAIHLQNLGLSFNKLTSLPQDIFVDMPALTTLFLAGNPLQTIDQTVFSPVWNQLRLLFFHDTSLSCDCRLGWLIEKNNTENFLHATCDSPAHSKGRHLRTMQLHELRC